MYFNCDENWPVKGSSENDSHCEKWRIIGSMDENTTGNSNKLVKIIRDSIGSMSWDYKENGVGSSTNNNGSNDWSDSQLMMMLNPAEYLNQGYRINNGTTVNTNTLHGRTYYVDEITGKVYYSNSDNTTQSVMQMTYNSTTNEWAGAYYNRAIGCKPNAVVSGNEYECSSINFRIIGLKDYTKNYIQEIDWKLGGYKGGFSSSEMITNIMYEAERGTNVVNNTKPTTWKGKVALMYVTDWALATSLTVETETGSGIYCKDTDLSSWKNYQSCYNNWLYIGIWQWSLAPDFNRDFATFKFGNYFYNSYYGNNASDVSNVRPTLYLKASTLVTGGTGTSSDPYQLML